jgi:hypothetical protein
MRYGVAENVRDSYLNLASWSNAARPGDPWYELAPDADGLVGDGCVPTPTASRRAIRVSDLWPILLRTEVNRRPSGVARPPRRKALPCE